MMAVKQKHVPFPVHFLDTIQLYPAPHRNFVESAEVDRWIAYMLRVRHRPWTRCKSYTAVTRTRDSAMHVFADRHVIQQTGDFSIFLTNISNVGNFGRP